MNIIWTDHAAKQLVKRGLDHERVLEVIAYGVGRKLFGPRKAAVRLGGIKVVACEKSAGLVIVTVMEKDKAPIRRNARPARKRVGA
jgi:hypothetical protein